MVQQAAITVFQVIQFIGIIVAIIASAYGVSRQIKKDRNEYVDNKMKMMDIRVSAIEKDILDNENHNTREHDRLTTLFDQINQKLDRLIERK